MFRILRASVGWIEACRDGVRTSCEQSLQLVRELMLPNWDIHPEMITHTRVIDTKTGRPMEPVNDATMENSFPHKDISVDELANYIAYALNILKNCELPCEGITTPGGFGNGVNNKLPLAVHQAVREVFGAELPHYFKYVVDGNESAAPKLEFVSDSQDVSQLTMNIPAGTGDWFGGWDGDDTPQPQLYSNADATSGRMVELVERNEPAIMLCHWPGMYCQGTKQGFHDFQRVVTALHGRFSSRTQWMKLSEIGRYWAARQLTKIEATEEHVLSIDAPLACADFTVRLRTERVCQPTLHAGQSVERLRAVSSPDMLTSGSFWSGDEHVIACFNLTKGKSRLVL